MVRTNETPYEVIGGEATLEALVETFYDKVAQHPVLQPIFPDDLTETKEKQKRFLTQFLGGPSLYTEVYGHPRLRARHLPFPIGIQEAEAWLACMSEAMDDIQLEGQIREFIFKRLEMTAHHMINTHDKNN